MVKSLAEIYNEKSMADASISEKSMVLQQLGKEKGGDYSLNAFLSKKSRELEGYGEVLKGTAEIGKVYLPISKSIFIGALLLLFVIGPGFIAVMTIFNVLPWWIFALGLLAIILGVMKQRRFI